LPAVVKITIENLGEKEVTASGTATLLQHLHAAGVDWMHACGGKGRCTTCMCVVTQGHEHLGTLTAAEQRYRQQGALQPGERLACQATLHGEVRLRVPEEYKLPHLAYTA